MDDWRSKPRTGKAQFIKHLDTIQQRLNAGETQNAIRQVLMQDAGLQISAAQFSRYLKSFGLTGRFETISNTARRPEIRSKNTATPASVPSNELEKKRPLTRADFKKIREDVDKMDLNALVSGQGIIFNEK